MLFFFTYLASTAFYTLSLHDALPISSGVVYQVGRKASAFFGPRIEGPSFFSFPTALCSSARTTYGRAPQKDRKSTRLNSSHEWISYAVFCLKKKIENYVT